MAIVPAYAIVIGWNQAKLKLYIALHCLFSSPEPLGSQGELIVYPSSRRPSVVRPSVVHPLYVHHFQRSSPLKPLGQSKQNFM